MDKVQNNESLFSVEELEQRLEMTAAATEMQAIAEMGPKTVDIHGFHWWFG